jgi:hypothetical protein
VQSDSEKAEKPDFLLFVTLHFLEIINVDVHELFTLMHPTDSNSLAGKSVHIIDTKASG